MNNTMNYGLGKPEIDDFYDVSVQNDNMDKMDTELKRVSDGEDETAAALNSHVANGDNPHHVTKAQLGLENVNNTADASKPVSEKQQAAIDLAYASANGYTDNRIANLINGAPTTLDTLKEIADAMAENADVVAALNEAIGSKANQSELDTHTGNSTIHITAGERNAWNNGLLNIFKSKASIPQNISLNTYTANGLFAVTSSAQATLALNYPLAGVGGVLQVIATGENACVQVYYAYTGMSDYVKGFARHYYTNNNDLTVWSDWNSMTADITYATSIVVNNNYFAGTLNVRKNNHVVEIIGDLSVKSPLEAMTNYAVGTIPTGYRPLNNKRTTYVPPDTTASQLYFSNSYASTGGAISVTCGTNIGTTAVIPIEFNYVI